MTTTTTEIPKAQKAVIYCRVSSKKQAGEGSGLDSQEHRCREYASSQGYEIVGVFPDDVSGGGDFIKRPGMLALLAYLDAFPSESFVVIFDDLKRYARDTEFHLKLSREMQTRNAVRECLNFKFEDSPEGKFIETIMAAQGELEREQNGRQVVKKCGREWNRVFMSCVRRLAIITSSQSVVAKSWYVMSHWHPLLSRLWRAMPASALTARPK